MICRKLISCVESAVKGQMPDKCNNDRETCMVSCDDRLYVKCEEKKKQYTLVNTKKKTVISYKMDGGIVHMDASVPEQTARCDYLYVINDEKPTAVLTELKGVDVKKAMNQIKSTLDLFDGFFQKCSKVYGRIVVSSSVPRIRATSEYVKLQRKLKDSYSGNLKIGELKMKEKDVELDKLK